MSKKELKLHAVVAPTQTVIVSAYDKDGKADAGRLCGTVKHVISECALIGWQSGGHSNGYVPAFAIGVGAEQFHGRFDNTEISKKMAKAAGWEMK